MCSTCFKFIMCDFEICFNAKTSLEGDKICLTRPKVPAPRVYTI